MVEKKDMCDSNKTKKMNQGTKVQHLKNKRDKGTMATMH